MSSLGQVIHSIRATLEKITINETGEAAIKYLPGKMASEVESSATRKRDSSSAAALPSAILRGMTTVQLLAQRELWKCDAQLSH